MDQPIILLDLNYTLVENVHPMHFRYGPTVNTETYRGWLIDLIRDHYVIMLTTRGKEYQDATLARIGDHHRWLPQEAYFKLPACSWWPAHEWKRMVMLTFILPQYGWEASQYLALESNRYSRAVFRLLGVHAQRVPSKEDERIWTKLPVVRRDGIARKVAGPNGYHEGIDYWRKMLQGEVIAAREFDNA